MAEYIEKGALMSLIESEAHRWGDDYDWWQCLADIEDFKPADVRPVVSSHWKKNDNGTYSCERCHSWIPEEQWHYANWCLYCGADMRGIEDKEPVDKFEGWSDELKQTYRELLEKLNSMGGDAE